MQNNYTIGIIGAGNMAHAIVCGLLHGQLLKAQEIIISDKEVNKLEKYAALGLATAVDNALLASSCKYLLLAVKPQIAPMVFDEVKSSITADTVISIMAGVSICTLQNALGNRNYARIMPNTPALVGEGMSAIAFSNDYNSDFVLNIFNSIGKTVVLDEKLFDAVTSLSGSGPAYVYTFIQALIDGGIEGGLDYDMAKTLALQTIFGATKMIESNDTPICDLIDAVCSKGGTTIEAINSFKEDRLDKIVIKGMKKCRQRSKELSGTRK